MSPEPIYHTHAAVSLLHRKLEKIMHKHLQMQVGITAPPEYERWKNMSSEKDFFFFMSAAATERPVYARRNRGGESEVTHLPISPHPRWPNNCWWVSWQDKWTTKPSRQIELREASLTFFWGTERDPDKDQILRAEWEEPPMHGQEHAAQPHWHIDPGKAGGSARADLTAEMLVTSRQNLADAPLEDLSSPIISRQLNTANLHLAMGGWELADIADNCWQKRVANDLNKLATWADKTLEYTIRQLRGVTLSKE